MSSDPPRLRSEAGSLEALLLRSAPKLEPPPSAEDEVWRRLQIAAGVGAAAGATSATSATSATTALAAGTKVGKVAWLSVLKWGAAIVITVPAVAVGARAILDHEPVAVRPVTQSVVTPAEPVAPVPVPPADPDLTPPAVVAPVDPPRAAPVKPRAPHAHAEAVEAPSALRAESALLSAARAKLAAGDPRGALEDAARLESKFPRGRLVQEREMVAIDALLALGNRPAARARGLAFVARFPGSPYSEHLLRRIEP